jgi:hypothetical protein
MRNLTAALALATLLGGLALSARAADAACDQSATIPAGAASDRQQLAASGLDPKPDATVPAGAASERTAGTGLDPKPDATVPAGAASERVAASGLDPRPDANVPAGAASERCK